MKVASVPAVSLRISADRTKHFQRWENGVVYRSYPDRQPMGGGPQRMGRKRMQANVPFRWRRPWPMDLSGRKLELRMSRITKFFLIDHEREGSHKGLLRRVGDANWSPDGKCPCVFQSPNGLGIFGLAHYGKRVRPCLRPSTFGGAFWLTKGHDLSR